MAAGRAPATRIGLLVLLVVACDGPRLLRVEDPARPADAADARFVDGSSDRAAPRPPDATIDGAIDAAIDARDAGDAAEVAADGPVTPGCPVDCNHLPHVRAGTVVGCSAGVCQVPAGACEVGFAHCSADPNDGCEADLSSTAACGSCYIRCSDPYPICYVGRPGSSECGPSCASPTPDVCYTTCTNLQTDPANCGACEHFCSVDLPHGAVGCSQGQCTLLGCSDPAWADCTPDPGCETPLGHDGACAACGDRMCTLANTLPACASADGCATAVCAPGFANCDGASPDCETAFAAAGSCLPAYLGTFPGPPETGSRAPVAIGTDGSYFVGGSYFGTVDFDPTAGQDIHSTLNPNAADGFVTKLNADGSYAWTRTFAGTLGVSVNGLAVAADGGVVVVGDYMGQVDLDPGPAEDLQQTADQFYGIDALVVKLAADGSFEWGRTFPGDDTAQSTAYSVAVDAADAVYVAGVYEGTVDFDDGSGMALHTAASQYSGMVVNLTADGELSWVQTFDDGTCGASLVSVALATDGTLWSVGWANAGAGCTLGTPPPGIGVPSVEEALIVQTGAAGDVRGVWTLGDGGRAQVTTSAVAPGPNGSIYVGGAASYLVDLDPGPGVAARWVPGSIAITTDKIDLGGYILKLGSDASFLWAETIDNIPIVGLAGTADGGVLGVGVMNGVSNGGVSNGAFVTRLNGDGSAVWTFASGASGTSATAVAAGATSFAVTGFNSGSGDLDPGAGVDVVSGDILFLSRYGL